MEVIWAPVVRYSLAEGRRRRRSSGRRHRPRNHRSRRAAEDTGDRRMRERARSAEPARRRCRSDRHRCHFLRPRPSRSRNGFNGALRRSPTAPRQHRYGLGTARHMGPGRHRSIHRRHLGPVRGGTYGNGEHVSRLRALLADRPAVVPAVSTVPATDTGFPRTGTPSERQRVDQALAAGGRRARVHGRRPRHRHVHRGREPHFWHRRRPVGAECSPATAARSAPPSHRSGTARTTRPRSATTTATASSCRSTATPTRPGDQRTSPGNCRRGRSRHPGLRSRPARGTTNHPHGRNPP